MIVKVQVSLFTTEKVRQVLIYNESRSIELQQDLTPEFEQMMAGELKRYFKAKLRRDGTLEVFENYVIAEQSW